MSMDPAIVLALAAQCAPDVSAQTLLAVARAESALNPFAIGVNGGGALRSRPTSALGAAQTARDLIRQGRNVDLGLGQINVHNLKRLGLTPEAAFDPCRNLAASARVLREGYDRATATMGSGQAALHVALSYYNTGDPQRGFRNGYVARVIAHAAPGSAPPAPRSPALPSRFADAVRLRASAAFVISPSGATP